MSTNLDPRGIINKMNLETAVRLYKPGSFAAKDITAILGDEKMVELQASRRAALDSDNEDAYDKDFLPALRDLVVQYGNMDPYEASRWAEVGL